MSEVLLDVQHLQTYLKSGEQLVKAVDDISFRFLKAKPFV